MNAFSAWRPELYEAEDKIRALQRRPMEWLLRAELVLMGLLSVAVWVLLIIDATSKN
jgi:hypothetical protein